MSDFVIQQNLLSAAMLNKVREAVAPYPHKFVGLIPFSREITSDEPIVGTDHIPYGSTSFIETTHALGWSGLYFNVHANYRTACIDRNDMLNHGIFMGAKNAQEWLSGAHKDVEFFIRPAHDLKQFSGTVMTAGDAAEFLKDAIEYGGSGSYKIDPDMLLVIAEPKTIAAESRWFIVGGKVIDGSYYRIGGQLKPEHIYGVGIAEPFADGWLPHENIVMDLAHMPDGTTKVIEFNCINGSGFYDHDVGKIMGEIYRYAEAA